MSVKLENSKSICMNLDQFNICVDNHADGLFRFVLGIVRTKVLAEDIVQDSYLKIWENRKKIEPDKEKSYLFTVAYRSSISALRNVRNHSATEVPIYSMAENREYDNRTELLWRELDTMSPAARTVVMLSDWEGYSYDEICQITQMSLPQVKITLHRARTTLKARLKDE